LTRLEEKSEKTKNVYSFLFSTTWIVYLYYIETDWIYVMILRGITLMVLAYTLSVIEDGSYINPPTNYELGVVGISSILSL